MHHADRRLGAALIVCALAWLWLVSTQIPDAGTEWPGPRGFPLLLGVALAILGVCLAAARATWNSRSPIPNPQSSIPAPRSRRIAAAVFALLVLYAFLLDKTGFVISTAALMMAALTVVLRIRRWLFVAAFAVVFSIGCWVVFNSLLGIPLPPGTWIAAGGAR